MTTPEKAKGSQFERDVAQYFRDNGFPYCERRYGAGATLDKGDITGLGPEIVIECKNHKSLDLSGWIGEAERERDNAHAKYGIVVSKRRNKGVANAYVVLTLADFVELWKERDA